MPNSYNSLTVKAFARGSTTSINNVGFDYRKISGLRFSSYWPGGLFGSASFYTPGDLATSWTNSGAHRIVFYNGLQVVWEGYVDRISRTAEYGTSGLLVECVGAWGNILAAQGIDKPWSDERTDSRTIYRIDSTGDELWRDFRDDGGILRVVPDPGKPFTDGWYVAFRYTAPTGQTVKRVAYAYDMLENAGEAWEMLIWNVGTGAAEAGTSITATGSGVHAVNLATPSQSIEFRYYARANQTASATANTNWAKWKPLGIKTETDVAITQAVIVADVIALATDINSSTSYISAPTSTAQPFITDGWKSYADIINDALSFGGASGANYYAQLLESDYLVQGADGKPVLQVGAYPALTAYEYELSLDDMNLVAPFTLDEDYSKIANYIFVSYTDATGKRITLTPTDSATLTDATSVSAYGRRDASIDAGTASAAAALAFGVRYLVKYSSPVWRLSAPISVVGYIRKGGDIRQPCSQIRAGERVLFSNFNASPIGDPLIGSNPLIAIITSAEYSDDGGGVCSLSFGDLNDLW